MGAGCILCRNFVKRPAKVNPLGGLFVMSWVLVCVYKVSNVGGGLQECTFGPAK